MRIFVSEFITSGALSGMPLPGSLLCEGRAMLSAIVDDLTALPGCQVFTTLDHRLALDHQLTLGSRVIEPSCNANVETCSVEVVDTADAERQAFDRLAASCDATLIIAPETDGMLAQRVRRVAALGGTALNCLPAAIELGGDKLRLAEHLSSHKIATIATLPADLNDEPWKLLGTACVLKPRDGAGSWLTFGIPDRDSAAWHRATVALIGAGLADRTILQPWIAGQALSVGCLCHSSGRVDLSSGALTRVEFRLRSVEATTGSFERVEAFTTVA